MIRLLFILMVGVAQAVGAAAGPVGFFPGHHAASGGGPVRSLLLDVVTTNQSSAKATWKLSTNYTRPLVRFRDSVGNVETDLFEGATPGTLNTVSGGGGTDALALYPGITNAFLVRWYDQVSSTLDAVQTTAGSQPMAIKAGAYVFTQNGYPCFSFTNAFMTITNGNAYAAPGQYPVYAAAKPTASVTYMGLFHPDNPTSGWLMSEISGGGSVMIERANSAKFKTSALSNGTPYLFDASYDGTTDHLSKNGSADENAVSDSGFSTNGGAYGTGYLNSTAQGWNGWIACVIVFTKAQSSGDKTGTRNNINTGDGVSAGLQIY